MTLLGVEKALSVSTTRTYTGIMRVPGTTPGTRPVPVLLASMSTAPGYADDVTAALQHDLGLPVLRGLAAVTAHARSRLLSLHRTSDSWALVKTGPGTQVLTVVSFPVPSERWQTSARAWGDSTLLFIGRDRDLPAPGTGSGQLYPWLHYRVTRGHFHCARVPSVPAAAR